MYGRKDKTVINGRRQRQEEEKQEEIKSWGKVKSKAMAWALWKIPDGKY